MIELNELHQLKEHDLPQLHQLWVYSDYFAEKRYRETTLQRYERLVHEQYPNLTWRNSKYD